MSTGPTGHRGRRRIGEVLVDKGLLTEEQVTQILAHQKSMPMKSAEVEREARTAGADDFLAKPVEPMLLEERVLALLGRQTRTLPTATLQ